MPSQPVSLVRQTTESSPQLSRLIHDPMRRRRLALSHRYGPGPAPSEALSRLQADPESFMRRHQVEVRGRFNEPSGPVEGIFVDQGPIATRRSSIDGSVQPVHSYHLMPRSAYNDWLQMDDRGPHRTATFQADHIGMEQAVGGRNTGTPLGRANATEAQVVVGRMRTYLTNALSGCSLVRLGNALSHWMPRGWGGTGAELEQGIGNSHPQANVFGPSQYRPGQIQPVNVFVQSGRRGSVHIISQDQAQTDAQGNWSANVRHTRFAPPQQLPAQAQRRQAMHTQLVQAVAQRAARRQGGGGGGSSS